MTDTRMRKVHVRKEFDGIDCLLYLGIKAILGAKTPPIDQVLNGKYVEVDASGRKVVGDS